MKFLVLMFLVSMNFLTAHSQGNGSNVTCINNQRDLEDSLTSFIGPSVEEAFVPDLYNASSFLIPRLMYILLTCDYTENIQDVIDDERAFVWTSDYLFVYMHPAVIRLVSLLDLTSLGLSVHTLRMCIPNAEPNFIRSNCLNGTTGLSYENAILKVREHAFIRKTSLFVKEYLDISDTWKTYVYDHAGYVINLHEALPNFFIATYSLFMGVFFLALLIGIVVMTAFSLQITNNVIAHERSANSNAKKFIPIFYRWSGVFSIVICCHVLFMLICYLLTSFKELSSAVYPTLSNFNIFCHIIAYIFIWLMGFISACFLPHFLAKKYFKNKLNLLFNRRSCGCTDRVILGFALTFCVIIFYHVLFGMIVFLYYPLLVLSVLISRLTYLTILGLCVLACIRLYMAFGICHVWIYSNIFTQIVIICLYYSVLYGVGSMLGIGYTLENSVLLKYIIAKLFVSVGVLIISYCMYAISCKPLFYSERELLKMKRQNKAKDDHDETAMNTAQLSPPLPVAGNNSNEIAIISPMTRAPDKVVYFAGGILLIKDGSVTWIPVNQK